MSSYRLEMSTGCNQPLSARDMGDIGIGYWYRYQFFKVISVTSVSVTYRLIGIGMDQSPRIDMDQYPRIDMEGLHTDTN